MVHEDQILEVFRTQPSHPGSRQIKDIFHVEEFPYGTFRGLGVALIVMGAVEITIVQPIRNEELRKQRLQEFITRSRSQQAP